MIEVGNQNWNTHFYIHSKKILIFLEQVVYSGDKSCLYEETVSEDQRVEPAAS